MKTAKFVAKHGVTMSVEQTGSNPNLIGQQAGIMSHWRCVLRSRIHPRKSMLVIFSMGSAHKNPPTVVDVLDCLASDAAGYENAKGDFAEWLAEYGFDLDLSDINKVRQYRGSYNVIGNQIVGLLRILGDAAYDRLVWHTERE